MSYTPIYFLNDYADVNEDKKLNKANLFLLINNKNLYWTIHFLLIISGFLLSFYINPLSVVILITLYLVNLIYSFPPLRLRNINFFRELLIFIIYFLKWLLIITYWNLSYGNLPVHILIMASSLAALNVSIYKRYAKENKIPEYFFGSIFIIFWIITITFYIKVLFLFLPLLPAVIYIWFKYRKKQIPIGYYQTLYFFYTVIIYALIG